mgnify:CR=1 FL=1
MMATPTPTTIRAVIVEVKKRRNEALRLLLVLPESLEERKALLARLQLLQGVINIGERALEALARP